MKGSVLLDTKIKKMRERLVKHRQTIAEMETQAAEMEREIKKTEEEQLGYLARYAANSLSGGMDEIFELLRSLQTKPDTDTADNAAKIDNNQNYDESKEDDTVEEIYETEE
jgi:phage shock protein A